MSPDDKEFARKNGLQRHLSPNPSRYANSPDSDVDFRDPSELPASSVCYHPVDEMEPEEEDDYSDLAALDLGEEDLREAADTFNTSLRWALDGTGLVGQGQRLAIMICLFRSDLAGGLPGSLTLRRDFQRNVKPSEVAILTTGIVFGRALEWARRASSLAGLGERLCLIAYVLRPQLINASTLQSLGDMTQKTRQAKDKGVNCLRDTFAGLQARTMRGDITRIRCQESHI